MKTIIMLCAHRTGSTAIFRMFQNHPEVGVCHVDQSITNTEPNFWNFAGEALQGDSTLLKDRFAQTHPFLEVPDSVDEEIVFDLWDKILSANGPAVFDKTPRYLDDMGYLDLILKYRDRGNDVRIFALMRDPRDVITSQHMLWKKKDKEWESPEKLEEAWLRKYANLEKFEEKFGKKIPVFKYEDFSENPGKYATEIFELCGVSDIEECYSHVRPVNIGRYTACKDKQIVSWRFSDEFTDHLGRYNYEIPQKVKKESYDVGYLSLFRRVKRKCERACGTVKERLFG